jgi:[acyl-carrier-protein] S-malonyltransferase
MARSHPKQPNPQIQVAAAKMVSMSKATLFLATANAAVAFRHVMSRVQPVRTLKMSAAPVSYKVGFMFPGQGAQAVGMAGALCEEVPAAKSLFEKASSILGYDLLAKCVNGPKEELDSTVVAQTAIFVSSMAAVEKLKVTDPAAVDSCTVAMGLSLGNELSLLNC